MDFSLTEEQQLLKDSVERFLEKNYSLELRRGLGPDDAFLLGIDLVKENGPRDIGLLTAMTDPRVVVVGSGPGGLQTSYWLRRLGIDHALLSQDEGPGGMFRAFPIFEHPAHDRERAQCRDAVRVTLDV